MLGMRLEEICDTMGADERHGWPRAGEQRDWQHAPPRQTQSWSRITLNQQVMEGSDPAASRPLPSYCSKAPALLRTDELIPSLAGSPRSSTSQPQHRAATRSCQAELRRSLRQVVRSAASFTLDCIDPGPTSYPTGRTPTSPRGPRLTRSTQRPSRPTALRSCARSAAPTTRSGTSGPTRTSANGSPTTTSSRLRRPRTTTFSPPFATTGILRAHTSPTAPKARSAPRRTPRGTAGPRAPCATSSSSRGSFRPRRSARNSCCSRRSTAPRRATAPREHGRPRRTASARVRARRAGAPPASLLLLARRRDRLQAKPARRSRRRGMPRPTRRRSRMTT